jgi:hypothetical protein
MKRLLSFSIVLSLLLGIILFACGGGGGGSVDSVTLRKKSISIDKTDLLESFKSKHLYCPGEKITGELILKNRFEPVVLGDAKVVNDHVTNLMWQQDEEATRFDWRETKAYVVKINEKNFAGYNDWRLPTAEELASLITPEKNSDNFIDPVFHKELLNTWTADEVEGLPLGAWFIDFSNGKPSDGNRAAGMGQVRLVRSI